MSASGLVSVDVLVAARKDRVEESRDENDERERQEQVEHRRASGVRPGGAGRSEELERDLAAGLAFIVHEARNDAGGLELPLHPSTVWPVTRKTKMSWSSGVPDSMPVTSEIDAMRRTPSS